MVKGLSNLSINGENVHEITNGERFMLGAHNDELLELNGLLEQIANAAR